MKSNHLTFTIPLNSAAHQIALEYYKQHNLTLKAKQVYLNTLAVYAVNTYLGYFGIKTDLKGSDSQNIVLQMLSDCADINIKGWGKLECRPVLPDASSCYIPPEVWSDRKGYIAVQFDRELKEATLLGFLSEIKESEISCDRWQSLEQLLEKVGEFTELSKEKVGKPILSQNIGKAKAKLSHWLQGAIDSGWQTLEELYPPQQLELGFHFRSKVNGYSAKKMAVERGKYLNLQRAEEQIALLVGLAPTANSEMDISIEIYPTNTQSYLPQDLQLMILDEDEDTIMQANARGTDRLQVKFSGEVGDCFNVKLALGDFSVIEFFEI